MFLKDLAIAVGASVLLANGPAALAQKATEVFIPVGQSPGASNEQTLMGTIGDVDGRTLTILLPSGTATATITDRTKIYLDRSKLRSTNKRGTVADLKKGLTVEVKYETREARQEGKGAADWIKVVVTP